MKNQFQPYDFKSVDEFLEFLPEDELKITEFLRKIVFDCIPHCTEKLNYNVPYYQLNKKICFIWPGSLQWGSKRAYDGVQFGFTSGHLLHDETGYLDKGTRKQVFWKNFKSIKEIDVDLLRSFIFEAVMIDERFAEKKSRSKRSAQHLRKKPI